MRRAGLLAAGLALAAAPAALADDPGTPAALDAAAAWSDSLEAYRVPERPPPDDTESMIALLTEEPSSAAPAADRRAAARLLAQRQEQVAAAMAGLGGTVTFRYRTLVNAIGVRLPAGRVEALASLPGIRAIVPVGYLAPAEADIGGRPRPGGPSAPPAPAPGRPLHIALIDAGIDPGHPALGGGMGPTFPVIGGADLVDGDADPRAEAAAAEIEAHGTKMAGIILGAPDLQGLPPRRVPRLLAYRVVAPEQVDGRVRPLARTDRVLAALERAMDPNGDGDPADAAEVVVLGLSRGFDGGGLDPLSVAVSAADRLGSIVVAPAGNDGPGSGGAGTVGGVAASPRALTVGGVGADTGPRTAALEIVVGPAEARIDRLPLIGAAPDRSALPVVILDETQAAAPADLRSPDGARPLAGALVVVPRDGRQIGEVARRLAAEGAAALAVWDLEGQGAFPGPPGGEEWELPVVGLGAAQGDALRRLAAQVPELRVRIAARPVEVAARAVASFSSRGPTAAGRAKPDLVAPAVGVPAPYPRRAGNGRALTSTLDGTSAAAAAVGALAARIRIDHPELSAGDVRAALVQRAAPLSEEPTSAQGAGAVRTAGLPRAVMLPPLPVARLAGDRVTASIAVRALDGRRTRATVVLVRPDGARIAVGRPVEVGPRARAASARLPIAARPGEALGRLQLEGPGGGVLAAAPLTAAAPSRTPRGALGRPVVTVVANGSARVLVRLGRLRRHGAGLQSVRLRAVRMWLVGGDGTRHALAGAKQPGEWPAGRYRFVLARRLADARPLPSGRFTLLVRALGPDGAALAARSAPFTLRGS